MTGTTTASPAGTLPLDPASWASNVSLTPHRAETKPPDPSGPSAVKPRHGAAAMLDLLFSPQGRISRSKLYFAVLLHLLGVAGVVMLLILLWQVMPGEVHQDGSRMSFNVDGFKAAPYLALLFGYQGLLFWSCACLAIKRFHDRGKSGAWVLILLVPFVGPLWYLVEVGFLPGTAGPNRFGPEPLGSSADPAAPS